MKSYVRVKFKSSSKTYSYFARGSVEELTQYSHAVVDSPTDGLVVTEIVGVDSVDESNYEGSYKFVVALFSLKAYDEIVAIETRKRAIEKELRRRMQQKSFIDQFEKLLGDDDDAAKLLQEYKSL